MIFILTFPFCLNKVAGVPRFEPTVNMLIDRELKINQECDYSGPANLNEFTVIDNTLM